MTTQEQATYLDQIRSQVEGDLAAHRQEIESLRLRLAGLEARLPQLEVTAGLLAGRCAACGGSLRDPEAHKECYER